MANSPSLLSTSQNRQTEWLCSEIFVFHIMFEDVTDSQAFLSTGQNWQTETLWELFVFHILFYQVSHSYTLLSNDLNGRPDHAMNNSFFTYSSPKWLTYMFFSILFEANKQDLRKKYLVFIGCSMKCLMRKPTMNWSK